MVGPSRRQSLNGWRLDSSGFRASRCNPYQRLTFACGAIFDAPISSLKIKTPPLVAQVGPFTQEQQCYSLLYP